MEAHAVAAGHEHAVGDADADRISNLLAIRPEALGEAHEDMRRTEVRRDGVGVEMLRRRFAEVQVLRLGPVQEVLRGGVTDIAHALGEVAEVGMVELPLGVPEDEILRVEGALALADDGLFADALPMQAIRGDEAEHRLPAHRLPALVRRGLRIGVQEWREVVSGAVLGVVDDVVLLRAVEFVEAQLRLGPGDAVVTVGQAGDLPALPGRAPVVHAEAAAVVQHRDVGVPDAFPRLVREVDGDLALRRPVQHVADVDGPASQVVIDEQLAPGADVDHGGRFLSGGAGDEQEG